MKIAIANLALLTGVLAACATAPTPHSRSYVEGQVAVSNAENMPVNTYGNHELTVARQRLEASRIASQNGQADLAEMLAIESIVSSDLAIAKTKVGVTAATNRQLQNQSNAMQQEMLRNKKVSP
ncbi:MAG: DUF4398 domain-containing protein [Limnobacter sp.]|jgi:hypothetical protein|uniref:DUF4398 domain-containing protein n=1 Tax=unclassified Limnobacter TaxID=2630203 RepID=UPI000CF556AB|nr:DUF4398 domain-containing protein [Limnobacter sp. SAORIC-690]PQJ25510.1 hypothetical protein BSZ31_11565 [Limnobacter sp. SAORIC-690]